MTARLMHRQDLRARGHMPLAVPEKPPKQSCSLER